MNFFSYFCLKGGGVSHTLTHNSKTLQLAGSRPWLCITKKSLECEAGSQQHVSWQCGCWTHSKTAQFTVVIKQTFFFFPLLSQKTKGSYIVGGGLHTLRPPILLNLLLLHERLHSMCVCNHTHLHLKPSKACSSPVFRAQNDLVSTQCNMCVSASGGSRYQTRAHTQPWHDKQKAMKPHE